MTSKLTFFYIWATALALNFSALTMLSEEKQKSVAAFHTVAIGNPELHMRKASHRGSKQE